MNSKLYHQIFNLRNVKILISVIVLLALILALKSCSDNDIDAQFKFYNKDLNIKLSLDTSRIAYMDKEIKKIVENYSPGLSLTHVEMIFNGLEEIKERKGKATFYYSKGNDLSIQMTQIEITYDMRKKVVETLYFSEGHPKKMTGYAESLSSKYTNQPLSKIFDEISKKSKYKKLISSGEKDIWLNLWFNYDFYGAELITDDKRYEL